MANDIRNTALIVWRAIEQGIEDPEPGITLDTEAAADPVAHAARLALLWIRKWHRLALAAGVTADVVQEIDGKAELVAVAEKAVREYVDNKIAALLPADAAEAGPQHAVAEQPTEEELLAYGHSPEFQIKAWDFVAACRDGAAFPSDDDHYFAVWLEGMLSGLYRSYRMSQHGSSREEADAAYAAMVDGQRAIYGSLAASATTTAAGTAATTEPG